ncbi:hypothetical protein DVH24_022229 [Malus domestica]|uniref:Uncharacterized protein n=1 Tax=Malus domestica TaxID=3750 RepID=A0A498IUK9_MALDO|nr:hypothetical protein DVH24_022229 [Malus domestica]
MVELFSLFNNSSHQATIDTKEKNLGAVVSGQGVSIRSPIFINKDRTSGLTLHCTFQGAAREIIMWDWDWNLNFVDKASGRKYQFKIKHTDGVIRLYLSDTGIAVLADDEEESIGMYPTEKHYPFYKMSFDQDGQWVVIPSP